MSHSPCSDVLGACAGAGADVVCGRGRNPLPPSWLPTEYDMQPSDESDPLWVQMDLSNFTGKKIEFLRERLRPSAQACIAQVCKLWGDACMVTVWVGTRW
jgi:hypothetical protein